MGHNKQIYQNKEKLELVLEVKPKNYQQEALLKIEERKKLNKNSAIIQMASGLGKTYLAGFESLNYCGKILFLCHREEILKQSKRVFAKIYYERNIKKTMGFYHGHKKQPDAEVLFASVSTIGRETINREFKPDEFDLIIIDEFHHALANTYKNVIDYFSPKFWLGITATPYRLNDPEGFKLKELINSNISYKYDLVNGIENKDLTPFILIFHKDNIDYSKIKFNKYKYNEKDLNKALLIKERDDEIIEGYKKHFVDRKCIGFCVSVKHVNRMVKLFNENGIYAEGVTCETDKQKRVQIENEFRDGEIKILFTRDIYNEGVDIPSVDGILLLRPTTSKVVFYQQIGRGLRKNQGKKEVMILDFVGNYKNAYLHREWLAKDRMGSKGYSSYDVQTKPEYSYPTGCKVIFHKEIIDLFEEQERRIVTKENLINEYYRMKKLLGRQPYSGDFRTRKRLSIFGDTAYFRFFGSWTKFMVEIAEPTRIDRIYANPSNEEIITCYKILRKKGTVPFVRLCEQVKVCKENFYTRFGSWQSFVRDRGDFPIYKLTRRDVIGLYNSIKIKCNKDSLTYEEFRNFGGCGGKTIRRFFGSYNSLLREMGDFTKKNPRWARELSKEEIINIYLTLKKKHGGYIPCSFFQKCTGVGQMTIKNNFGSWYVFVTTCGERAHRHKYSDKELHELKKNIIGRYNSFKSNNGNVPSLIQLGHNKGVINKLFGGYGNLKESQGDTRDCVRTPKYSETMLIEKYTSLKKKQGDVSFRLFNKSTKISRTVIKKNFGSWGKFVSLCSEGTNLCNTEKHIYKNGGKSLKE